MIQSSVGLYKLTRGVIGGRFGSTTMLLLTTTGRKTGRPRTTPLRYLREGDAYMIVASNWGQEQFPAWFKNLESNPSITIQVMGQQIPVQAEIVSPEQHDHLYQKFIDADSSFARYRETAHRIIPVILLHPR